MNIADVKWCVRTFDLYTQDGETSHLHAHRLHRMAESGGGAWTAKTHVPQRHRVSTSRDWTRSTVRSEGTTFRQCVLDTACRQFRHGCLVCALFCFRARHVVQARARRRQLRAVACPSRPQACGLDETTTECVQGVWCSEAGGSRREARAVADGRAPSRLTRDRIGLPL